jgi:tetratricopeptide (TPR) repeat protein
LEPATRHEVELRVRYAELALRSGELDEASTQLEALAADGQALQSHGAEIRRLSGLASEAAGNLDDAVRLLEDARRLTQGTEQLVVCMDLCRCYRDAGDLGRSLQIGEAGRQLAADNDWIGFDEEIRLTLSVVATYFERGDAVYAAQLCREAIDRAEARESATARASGYWNASVIASERGQHEEALGMAQRALALLSEGEDRRSLARLRLQYGTILLNQQRPDLETAIATLQRAHEELTATGAGAADVARCQVEVARALFLLGDLEHAATQAASALDAADGSAPFVQAEGQALLGRIAAQSGDVDGARDHYHRAVIALSAAMADREVAELWFELGELLEEAGDDKGSRDAFRRASASLGLRRTRASVVAAT